MAVTPSGKDKLLRHARLYVDGYDISGDSRTFGTVTNAFGEVPLHGWGEDTEYFMSNGRRRVGLQGYQAMVNDATNQSHDMLKTVPNGRYLSFCFGGGGEPSYGDPATLLPGLETEGVVTWDPLGIYSVSYAVDASTMGSLLNPYGWVLHGPQSVSTTITASNATSIDLGAAQTKGWGALLHIIATASGNFSSFRVRHSTDDVAFATLATFTLDGSAVAVEMQSGTTTVNRYVSFDCVRVGGSCTPVMTFAYNT